MKRYRLALITAPLLAALIHGCGGGSARPAPGRVSLTVVWPERTRLIPVAAESIAARLTGPGGYDEALLFVRSAGQTEVTKQWLDLQPGTYTLAAAAHPVADGSGTALASGSSAVLVEPGVNRQVTVTMSSTIDRVAITPTDSRVTVGATLQLTATAYDASGAVVLTTPGTLNWTTTTSNLLTVSNAGLVSGVAAGTGSVTATETECGKSATVAVAVDEPSQTRYYVSVGGPQSYVMGARDPWLSSPVYYQPTGPDALLVPFGVAVDAQGRIYIADRNAGAIVRIDDVSGAGRATFGTWGTGVNQFRMPMDVFVDDNGRILVADTQNGRIVRMDDMSGAGWTELGGMSAPYSVCTDGQGRIYVADFVDNRVSRVDDLSGTNRADLYPLLDVMSVRVGPSGRIYIAQNGGNADRIVRLDDMLGAGMVERTGLAARRLAIDSRERVLYTSANGHAVRLDSLTDAEPETFDCGGPGLDVWGIALYEQPPP